MKILFLLTALFLCPLALAQRDSLWWLPPPEIATEEVALPSESVPHTPTSSSECDSHVSPSSETPDNPKVPVTKPRGDDTVTFPPVVEDARTSFYSLVEDLFLDFADCLAAWRDEAVARYDWAKQIQAWVTPAIVQVRAWVSPALAYVCDKYHEFLKTDHGVWIAEHLQLAWTRTLEALQIGCDFMQTQITSLCAHDNLSQKCATAQVWMSPLFHDEYYVATRCFAVSVLLLLFLRCCLEPKEEEEEEGKKSRGEPKHHHHHHQQQHQNGHHSHQNGNGGGIIHRHNGSEDEEGSPLAAPVTPPQRQPQHHHESVSKSAGRGGSSKKK